MTRAYPCVWAWIAVLCLISGSVDARPWKTRAEFARRMNQVRESMTRELPLEGGTYYYYEGMTQDEARRLVGHPAVVIQLHPAADGFPYPSTTTWRYGCSRNAPYPTLGEIRFNARGRVSAVFGGAGEPLPEGTVSELKLREAFRRMDRIPNPWWESGSRWNPLPLIRAANFLKPLGKMRILATIREYQRVRYCATSRNEVEGFGPPYLHTLFAALFDTSSAPGEEYGLFLPPRWSGDIPLRPYEGGGLAGSWSFQPEQFDYYHNYGTLRSQRLQPPDNPLRIAAELPATTDERGVDEASVRGQLLKLLGSVYRPVLPLDISHEPVLKGPEADAAWRRMIAEVDRLGIRWDPRRDDYIFPDGSQLPPERPWVNRPLPWHAQWDGLGAYVSLTRIDRRVVEITLQWQVAREGRAATLRLVQQPSRYLERKELAAYAYPVTGRQRRYFELPQGATVELEFLSAGQRKTGRLKP